MLIVAKMVRKHKCAFGSEYRIPRLWVKVWFVLTAKLNPIVLHWNDRTHLERSLNSIKQQVTGNHKVIAVDNASVDDSIEYPGQISLLRL
jgi:hypothetical protein